MSREAVRNLDQTAIEQLGIPGLVLMENVARAVTHWILTELENTENKSSGNKNLENKNTGNVPPENEIMVGENQVKWPKVLIFCGIGNNAGDGLAVARHLQLHGINFQIFLCANPERFRGDARFQYELARKLDLPMTEIYAETEKNGVFRAISESLSEPILNKLSDSLPDNLLENLSEKVSENELKSLSDNDTNNETDNGAENKTEINPSTSTEHEKFYLVDALLGTGATGVPRFPMNAVISWMNMQATRGCRLLAVDVPTGLDCETGRPFVEEEIETRKENVAPEKNMQKECLLHEKNLTLEKNGLNSENWRCSENVIYADITLTLAAAKPGLVTERARKYVGELWISDIGVSVEKIKKF
ncbi:MAG: NAD(P)H-hydrate epimerase [Planctomycetia bacterium]|nr:NAD(P)H-hydrate epimerase [Planctomycetia bacterium]